MSRVAWIFALCLLTSCGAKGVPSSSAPGMATLYRHLGISRASRPVKNPRSFKFVHLVHVQNGQERVVTSLQLGTNVKAGSRGSVEVINDDKGNNVYSYSLHYLGQGVEFSTARKDVSFQNSANRFALGESPLPWGEETLLASAGPTGSSSTTGDSQHSDELILRFIPDPGQ